MTRLSPHWLRIEFAALFIALTLLDTYEYRSDVESFPDSEKPAHIIGGETIEKG